MNAPTDLHFEVAPTQVDQAKRLLYMWEVFDLQGAPIYRYIGKAEGGAARPLEHYRRNVRNLLAGRPYRKGKPDEFRAVHRRLAAAMRAGYMVRLTFLRNVLPSEDIYAAERAAQQEMNCGELNSCDV